MFASHTDSTNALWGTLIGSLVSTITRKRIVASFDRIQTVRAEAKFDGSVIFLFCVLDSTSRRKRFQQSGRHVRGFGYHRSALVRRPVKALGREID
jgi:hypothetical protein